MRKKQHGRQKERHITPAFLKEALPVFMRLLSGFLVEPMHPVRPQIVDQVDHRADAPCQRVSPVNVSDFPCQLHHGDNISDPDHAPDRQHDEHGHKGLPRAPADSGHGVGECKQTVEQCDGTGLTDSEFYDSGSLVEQRDEPGSKNIAAYAYELRQKHGGKDAEAGAFFCPVVLLCPQILADEGGACHIEAGDGQECKAFDLGMGAIGRHSQLSEGIDLGLHDHVGESDDGILDAGGQSVAYDLYEHIFFETDLFPFHGKDISFFQQMGHAEHHAGSLRDDRGQSRGPDPLMEDCQKQQIQHNVEQGGEDQVVQRSAAVPQRVHDASADIVQGQGKASQKVVAEIFHCLRHYLRIRLHPVQEGGGEGHTHCREDYAACDAESQYRVDAPGYLSIVTCPEIP